MIVVEPVVNDDKEMGLLVKFTFVPVGPSVVVSSESVLKAPLVTALSVLPP